MPASWSEELLQEMRHHGDPIADEVIARLFNEHGEEAVDTFFHTLIGNLRMPVDDIPVSVETFLTATNALPAWADELKMQMASEYFVDHGPKWLVLLFFKSLPLLYVVGDGATVLTRTGRLAHNAETMKVFSRRIAETGQFLLDVMSPDAFHSDTDGFRRGIDAIQKVRLIYASIRHFVQRGDWDKEDLGVPVNQTHLAITLMTFSVALTDGLHQFGIAEEPEKQEAFLHRWKVIGHLLGVDQRLLPDDVNNGRTLLRMILEMEAKETEHGKILTKALVEFTKDAIPKERLDATPELLIRFLVGEDISRKLGVSLASGCLGVVLPEVIGRLFNLIEKLEDKDIALERILDVTSSLLMQYMLGVFREKKGARFNVPEALRMTWGIDEE